MKISEMLRSKKAFSPVIATLILMLIAVAAGYTYEVKATCADGTSISQSVEAKS